MDRNPRAVMGSQQPRLGLLAPKVAATKPALLESTVSKMASVLHRKYKRSVNTTLRESFRRARYLGFASHYGCTFRTNAAKWRILFTS